MEKIKTKIIEKVSRKQKCKLKILIQLMILLMKLVFLKIKKYFSKNGKGIDEKKLKNIKNIR